MSPEMPQPLVGQSLVFLRVVVVFQGLYNSTYSSCSMGGVSTKTDNFPEAYFLSQILIPHLEKSGLGNHSWVNEDLFSHCVLSRDQY